MNPFSKNGKQFSIFVTAGYPKLHSLPDQIQFLESNGIDFVEVGIPFSDPMADGPTIQRSSEIALQNGMNVTLMFDQLESTQSNIPLVIMSYFNPILHFGLDQFLERCIRSKVAHVIIPDISLEVYEKLYQSIFESYGVTLCFLVTPRTSSERIAQMSKYSKNGFIYLVSSSMTTGGKSSLPSNTSATSTSSAQRPLSVLNVRVNPRDMDRIRGAVGDTPLMIGFGIKSREDVLDVHQIADGAIIGSAYIKALTEGREKEFISNVSVPELQNP